LAYPEAAVADEGSGRRRLPFFELDGGKGSPFGAPSTLKTSHPAP
jgi:hypothetical protein